MFAVRFLLLSDEFAEGLASELRRLALEAVGSRIVGSESDHVLYVQVDW